MARYDVFGVCNPLYDIQAEVGDELLEEFGLQKGGMHLVDLDQQRAMLPRVHTHIVNSEAGGSGANTMIGLAQLGGTGVYTGKVGRDEHADLYRHGLEAKGVRANLGNADGDTGICLVLITPDKQRTMCTFLGESRSLERADVRVDDLSACSMLYATAYLWDTDTQKDAVQFAFEEANRLGVKVALSLSDPFCVARHKDDLLRLVRNHVDLIVGNWTEAQALTDTHTPEDACHALASWAEVAVVTKEAQGSVLRRGDEVHDVPVYPETRVDTTGAGDVYSSGLLYGLTRGLPLDATGRIATYIAGRCVATLGPRLPSIDLEAVDRARRGERP